jgi:hypothetical protein
MKPGMMPILHSPGVMMPGQLGPMRLAPLARRAALTLIMSRTGMPSVMQTMTPMPASAASRMASAAKAGGHVDHGGVGAGLAHGIVHRVEHRQVEMGWPPLPGVTPPTIRVP